MSTKKFELMQRTAETKRMTDILLPLQDGDRVCAVMSNSGFTVEHFFKPEKFAV